MLTSLSTIKIVFCKRMNEEIIVRPIRKTLGRSDRELTAGLSDLEVELQMLLHRYLDPLPTHLQRRSVSRDTVGPIFILPNN